MNQPARYPDVESWSIDFVERGKPQPDLQVYKWTAPVEDMGCSNPACANGGFALGPLYAKLVAKKLTNNGADGESVMCRGSEFAGRKPLGKSCLNRAILKISLVYRPVV